MKPLKSLAYSAAVLSALAATGAYAQISTINSAVLQTRVFNDIPGATGTYLNNYPSYVSLSEAGVSTASGFADRDVWRFSSDGSTPYQIQNGQYFSASFDLTVTDSSDTPRKEVGFLFSTANVGDIQYFVDSDAHEVVQIGGSSFFSFNGTDGITYHSGQTINMGLTYTKDPNTGYNALVLSANGVYSPYLDFSPSAGNGSTDIGNGSTLGGYFQIVNDPNNANNQGTALFSNIQIGPAVVPEPSALALLGLGVLPLVFRRRNNS